MLWITLYLNTPLKGSTRYGQILKTWLDKVVDHLILAGLRLNKRRILLVKLQKTVNIFAHAEKI
ncbi:hypothetical protein D3C81_1940630 [compost metagenome]